MIYPYTVVRNGIWYPSGSDVPDGENKVNYTKTEINRMPVSELKTLGEKLGILGFETMTGTELKKEIINKL